MEEGSIHDQSKYITPEKDLPSFPAEDRRQNREESTCLLFWSTINTIKTIFIQK